MSILIIDLCTFTAAGLTTLLQDNNIPDTVVVRRSITRLPADIAEYKPEIIFVSEDIFSQNTHNADILRKSVKNNKQTVFIIFISE